MKLLNLQPQINQAPEGDAMHKQKWQKGKVEIHISDIMHFVSLHMSTANAMLLFRQEEKLKWLFLHFHIILPMRNTDNK